MELPIRLMEEHLHMRAFIPEPDGRVRRYLNNQRSVSRQIYLQLNAHENNEKNDNELVNDTIVHFALPPDGFRLFNLLNHG